MYADQIFTNLVILFYRIELCFYAFMRCRFLCPLFFLVFKSYLFLAACKKLMQRSALRKKVFSQDYFYFSIQEEFLKSRYW